MRPGILTRLDDARDDFDRGDVLLLEGVERDGYATISVEPDAAGAPEWEGMPPWTYTIGLAATAGRPDLVVFGLSGEAAEALVAEIVRSLEGGGEPSLEAVDRGWNPELFGFGCWFYKGTDFAVVQCLAEGVPAPRLDRPPDHRGAPPPMRG
jgi:hypothetical protein